MEAVFLTILNMSITAGWLVLAVILLRVFLKKVSQSLVVVMWALVGIRLICPFYVESMWSMVPSVQTIPKDIVESETIEIKSGISRLDNIINSGIEKLGISQESEKAGQENNSVSISNTNQNVMEMPEWLNWLTGQSENLVQGIVNNMKTIWMIGMILMLTYNFISWMKLHRKVQISIPYEENIYFCDEIDNAFVFGVIRPKIYIPSGVDEKQIPYIIEHEYAHLARKDHWWKFLGIVLLAVYWFHPMMWVAYILFNRDIEIACDEMVIINMNAQEKKRYSNALVACSLPTRNLLVCPLAFGEIGVKERVKVMRNYKKPQFGICVAAIVACVGLTVGFLTNPKSLSDDEKNNNIKYINEYAAIWREGEYPSLVKYNSTLYTETTVQPENLDFYGLAQRGIVESCVESGVPKKHCETNDENLLGKTVYMGAGYMFFREGDTYIPYQSVTKDDEFFDRICGPFNTSFVDSLQITRNREGLMYSTVQNNYLTALANAKENYLQYYGGSQYSNAEDKTIIWLTKINDDIIQFYDSIVGTDVVYKKSDFTMNEIRKEMNYIDSYLEKHDSLFNKELNELVESVKILGWSDEQCGIRVGIMDCTDEKIELFKRKISDAEYIYFENIEAD